MKNVIENLTEKYEAKKDQLRQDKYVEFLEFRKCKDAIPANILVPEDSDYHYFKCRHGFFTAVRNGIRVLILSKAVTDLLLIEEGNKFIEFVRSNSFSQRRTTKEDIDYVNSILDKFIEALKL